MTHRARPGISGTLSVVVTSLLVAWISIRSDEAAKPPPKKLSVSITTAVEMAPTNVVLPTPPPPASETAAPAVVEPAAPPSSPPLAPAEQRAPYRETSNPTSFTVPPRAIRAGRALLRKFEAGDGPSIEIAWPRESLEREALYQAFVRCHGMVTAILSSDGTLFRAGGVPGRPWRPNRDRFSLYAREASGELTPSEKHLVDRIRRRHGVNGGVPVRLFPRDSDARMLAGLLHAAGDALTRGKGLQARYGILGRKIEIRDIRTGPQTIPGRIVLGSDCR